MKNDASLNQSPQFPARQRECDRRLSAAPLFPVNSKPATSVAPRIALRALQHAVRVQILCLQGENPCSRTLFLFDLKSVTQNKAGLADGHHLHHP